MTQWVNALTYHQSLIPETHMLKGEKLPTYIHLTRGRAHAHTPTHTQLYITHLPIEQFFYRNSHLRVTVAGMFLVWPPGGALRTEFTCMQTNVPLPPIALAVWAVDERGGGRPIAH